MLSVVDSNIGRINALETAKEGAQPRAATCASVVAPQHRPRRAELYNRGKRESVT